MKRAIEIVVRPSGDIEIDAVGFQGADCERATRYLEEALGLLGNPRKKPEYQARARTRQQRKLGGS